MYPPFSGTIIAKREKTKKLSFMNMLSKGFGCFVFILCISLSLQAKELHRYSPQENDTSIAVTGVAAASALNLPAEDDNVSGSIAEETGATREAVNVTQAIAKTQNKFSTLHPMAVSILTAYEKKHEDRLEKSSVQTATGTYR